MIFLLRQT